jgi:1,4-dihydroxy-6-naphthoate synthase
LDHERLAMTQPPLIRVAHSPDSDDAFMFYGLAHHLVDTEGLAFEHHLCDIETLNQDAFDGKYEMTAISYHAYAHLRDKYALLTVGSSVGDKYGPVVITSKPMTRDDLSGQVVAIPGQLTTAHLILKIWNPDVQTAVVPFDQIMDRVKSGEFVAGVIIHEGQLTFAQEGFYKVADLGEWWFQDCNLTLPLGANAIRKDLGPELIQKIARVFKRSVEYSLAHREQALDYAMTFARGLERAQADTFVGMYVNEMTLGVDVELRKAVKLLLWRGQAVGLLADKVEPEFIDVLEPVAS